MPNELAIVIEKTTSGVLDAARAEDRYQLISRHYPFGDRLSFVPKAGYNPCEDLQNSRGISFESAVTVDEVVQKISADMRMSAEDNVRATEFKRLVPAIGDSLMHHVDVGFRIPRLLSFYENEYYMKAVGVDISHVNVEIARSMGFEAYAVDLSTESVMPVIAEPCAVTCYHVIEHSTDPFRAVIAIARMMRPGSALHIEVPIEPGVPRLRYGHMSEFAHGDLAWMLENVGLKVISTISENYIERCTALKE